MSRLINPSPGKINQRMTNRMISGNTQFLQGLKDAVCDWLIQGFYMSLLGSKVILFVFRFHIMCIDFLIHFFLAKPSIELCRLILKEVLFVSDSLLTLQ